MDKSTKARKTLSKAIRKQLKKYGDRLDVYLQLGDKMFFYTDRYYGTDEKFTYEMGFRYAFSRTDLLVVRTKFNGAVDFGYRRTPVKDLELAMKYMPVVEKFLEVEAERAGLGTE